MPAFHQVQRRVQRRPPPPRKPPPPKRPPPKRSPPPNPPPPPKRLPPPNPPPPKWFAPPRLLARWSPVPRACASLSIDELADGFEYPLDECCCQPSPVFLYTFPLTSA